MCNLSEDIYEQGMVRGAEMKTIEVIRNLWKKA